MGLYGGASSLLKRYFDSIVASGQASAIPPRNRLVAGSSIRCPGCGALCKPGYHLRALDRNEEYADELNIVYQHNRDHGGCGHIFSPGDLWVLQAYVSGELVPRGLLDAALKLIARYEAAESSSNNEIDNKRGGDRRHE